MLEIVETRWRELFWVYKVRQQCLVDKLILIILSDGRWGYEI